MTPLTRWVVGTAAVFLSLAAGAAASDEGAATVQKLQESHVQLATKIAALEKDVKDADKATAISHAYDGWLWVSLGVVGVAMAWAWSERGRADANARILKDLIAGTKPPGNAKDQMAKLREAKDAIDALTAAKPAAGTPPGAAPGATARASARLEEALALGRRLGEALAKIDDALDTLEK
jgi:hypothetical protein